MKKIKMMIVEDEDILREGILRVGNWSHWGVDICGLASNGKEALELIERNRPDVVLTDVVMPVMDGIELTKQVYERYPGIKVIILSGHEEFRFAKSAVEYKAYNYLLKPAKIEKIVETVSAARDEILTERAHLEEEEKLKEKLRESLPVLREHYMNRLIGGANEEEENIKEQFDFLKIRLRNEYLVVIICELDKEDGKNRSLIDLRLSNLQLMEICRNIIGGEYACCTFSDLEERAVTVLNYPADMPVRDILLYLSGKAVRIQNEMEKQHGKAVSAGMGRPVRKICYLGKAYREAVSALTYRFFMGSRSVIYIGDVEQKDEGGQQHLEQAESEILACLKSGDVEGTKFQTERYFTLFEQLFIREQGFIYEEITFFITNTLRSLQAKIGQKAGMLDRMSKLLKALRRNAYPTLKMLQEQVKGVLCETAEAINADRVLRSEGLIDKAKNYVKKHLAQDVSLITVAEAVYISPNYLSFLFKESGENFKDYVVRVKMEKAEEMIESGQYHLSQIAYALGYKDGRYFSQVYKKYKSKAVEVSIHRS